MILLFCEDPVVGSLTSLECGLDGFHKLSHMAEEVFGDDVFSVFSSGLKNLGPTIKMCQVKR